MELEKTSRSTNSKMKCLICDNEDDFINCECSKDDKKSKKSKIDSSSNELNNDCHSCCIKCFNKYLQQNVLTVAHKIKSNEGIIPCPADKCNNNYDTITAFHNMKDSQRVRYLKLLEDQMKEDALIKSLKSQLVDNLTLKCPHCSTSIDPNPDGCAAVMCLTCGKFYCNACLKGQMTSSEAHIHAATHLKDNSKIIENNINNNINNINDNNNNDNGDHAGAVQPANANNVNANLGQQDQQDQQEQQQDQANAFLPTDIISHVRKEFLLESIASCLAKVMITGTTNTTDVINNNNNSRSNNKKNPKGAQIASQQQHQHQQKHQQAPQPPQDGKQWPILYAYLKVPENHGNRIKINFPGIADEFYVPISPGGGDKAIPIPINVKTGYSEPTLAHLFHFWRTNIPQLFRSRHGDNSSLSTPQSMMYTSIANAGVFLSRMNLHECSLLLHACDRIMKFLQTSVINRGMNSHGIDYSEVVVESSNIELESVRQLIQAVLSGRYVDLKGNHAKAQGLPQPPQQQQPQQQPPQQQQQQKEFSIDKKEDNTSHRSNNCNNSSNVIDSKRNQLVALALISVWNEVAQHISPSLVWSKAKEMVTSHVLKNKINEEVQKIAINATQPQLQQLPQGVPLQRPQGTHMHVQFPDPNMDTHANVNEDTPVDNPSANSSETIFASEKSFQFEIQVMNAIITQNSAAVNQLLSMKTPNLTWIDPSRNVTLAQLCIATKQSDLAERFFDLGASYGRCNGKNSMIWMAIEFGQAQLLSKILKKHPKIRLDRDDTVRTNPTDTNLTIPVGDTVYNQDYSAVNRKWTLLHACIKHNQIDCLEILIKHITQEGNSSELVKKYVNINQETTDPEYHITAVNMAAMLASDLEVIMLLNVAGVEYTSVPILPNQRKKNLLYILAERGRWQILKAIIHSRNGNNNHNHIHDSDNDHNTVNITGLKLKLLTTTPMNINASLNDAGFTLLHIAAFSKQAILVRKLLEIGCDPNVNQGVRTRMTPLISAISSKSYACALELINHPETDLYKTNDKGRTPLYVAIEIGSTMIIDKLVERGVSLTSDITEESHGRQALCVAIIHRQTHVVDYLLRRGINVDSMDNTGSTALITAIIDNNIEATHLLLQNNASLGGRNMQGRNLLYAIIERRMSDFLIMIYESLGHRKELIQLFDEPCTLEGACWYVLHCCVEFNRVQLLQYIWEICANNGKSTSGDNSDINSDGNALRKRLLNHKSGSGSTPLMLAKMRNKIRMIAILEAFEESVNDK